LAHKVSEHIEQVVPMSEEKELDALVAEVPEEHRPLVHEAMRHAANHYHRYFAAAVAATLVREQMQPNSAVTLYPAGLIGAGGVPIKGIPGTAYPLVPIVGGAATAGNNYQFVRGQRFFGILTHATDANAGWYILQNSLKLATDAISGLAYGDVSFAVFEQDVVAGRMITGEYERHEFLEEVSFFATAILYSAVPEFMVEGLTVQFFDERCANRKYFDLSALRPDFPGLVREIMEEVNAGLPAHRLGRRFIRHHHRAAAALALP
jgi:hypothetical protein